MMMEQRLLREPAARRYLGGMSHGAFFGLRKQGLIEPVKVGRAAYYDVRDLDELVEKLRDGDGVDAAPLRHTA